MPNDNIPENTEQHDHHDPKTFSGLRLWGARILSFALGGPGGLLLEQGGEHFLNKQQKPPEHHNPGHNAGPRLHPPKGPPTMDA